MAKNIINQRRLGGKQDDLERSDDDDRLGEAALDQLVKRGFIKLNAKGDVEILPKGDDHIRRFGQPIVVQIGDQKVGMYLKGTQDGELPPEEPTKGLAVQQDQVITARPLKRRLLKFLDQESYTPAVKLVCLMQVMMDVAVYGNYMKEAEARTACASLFDAKPRRPMPSHDDEHAMLSEFLKMRTQKKH